MELPQIATLGNLISNSARGIAAKCNQRIAFTGTGGMPLGFLLVGRLAA